MESQDHRMTEMEAVIYNVTNSEPVIFKGINDMTFIMSLVINKNPLRIKNAIFETERGIIYCNSNDKVYNIVIPKEMQESFITTLIAGESRLKDMILNIYYQGAKWEYMLCDNSQEFKSLDERFSEAIPFVLDNFTNVENFKTNQIIEPCLSAMIVNEALNKIIITASRNTIHLHAEYSRESNTLTYYHKQHHYNTTPMILGCKLMEKEFKKIKICGYTFSFIGTKC